MDMSINSITTAVPKIGNGTRFVPGQPNTEGPYRPDTTENWGAAEVPAPGDTEFKIRILEE